MGRLHPRMAVLVHADHGARRRDHRRLRDRAQLAARPPAVGGGTGVRDLLRGGQPVQGPQLRRVRILVRRNEGHRHHRLPGDRCPAGVRTAPGHRPGRHHQPVRRGRFHAEWCRGYRRGTSGGGVRVRWNRDRHHRRGGVEGPGTLHRVGGPQRGVADQRLLPRLHRDHGARAAVELRAVAERPVRRGPERGEHPVRLRVHGTGRRGGVALGVQRQRVRHLADGVRPLPGRRRTVRVGQALPDRRADQRGAGVGVLRLRVGAAELAAARLAARDPAQRRRRRTAGGVDLHRGRAAATAPTPRGRRQVDREDVGLPVPELADARGTRRPDPADAHRHRRPQAVDLDGDPHPVHRRVVGAQREAAQGRGLIASPDGSCMRPGPDSGPGRMWRVRLSAR
ncbi:hypothetical protein RHCRD62_10657 [Rhodococcus sp. RD6.2]|nr:hypothetical protein RHCRD62_10657 [Rhodococcus sp. RD6.2]